MSYLPKEMFLAKSTQSISSKTYKKLSAMSMYLPSTMVASVVALLQT